MNRFIREILKEQKETILWIYQIKTKEILDIIPFNGTNSNNLLSSNLKINKDRSIKMLKKTFKRKKRSNKNRFNKNWDNVHLKNQMNRCSTQKTSHFKNKYFNSRKNLNNLMTCLIDWVRKSIKMIKYLWRHLKRIEEDSPGIEY